MNKNSPYIRLQQEYHKVVFGHQCYILVSYADDSTLLKVILSKDLWVNAAAEINADLCRIVDWGRKLHFEFKPSKSNCICLSLKRDLKSIFPYLWIMY